MSIYQGTLKQSTAINVTVMIKDTTHYAGKTGATLTIYATKAAGTPASISPTVTELDSTNAPGLYKLALTTAHTNTLGELQLHITASGADPADYKWTVSASLPDDIAGRLPSALSGDGYIMADMRSIDDELTSGNNAVLKLKQLSIVTDVDGEPAVDIESVGAFSGNGITIYGADGINITGESNGIYAFSFNRSINAPGGIFGSDDEDLSVTNITDKNWDEAVSGHTTAGTTGDIIGNSVPGIKTQTDKLTFDSDNYVESHPMTGVTVTTNNDKTGYSLTSAYDPAKTASQDSDMQTALTDLSTIEAKTNQLTFTNPGEVDANVQAINDTEVTGDGSATPWGPA